MDNVILLKDVILMPDSKIQVKSTERDWFYAEILPRPDQNKIAFTQDYDEEYHYFTLENITNEPQTVSLSLHWNTRS